MLRSRGTAFPSEVTTHTGRVQVADTMRTHQELVENAVPRVETSLPYHVTHYQEARKKNPDWTPSLYNQFVKFDLKSTRSSADSQSPLGNNKTRSSKKG